MGARRRFSQSSPLEERLAEEAKSLREQAKKLPHGPQREALLRRARQKRGWRSHDRMAYVARLAAAGVKRKIQVICETKWGAA